MSDVPLAKFEDLQYRYDSLREKLGNAQERIEELEANALELHVQLKDTNRLNASLQIERDRLTVLAELMWQSKTLLEAHQHFVTWRDHTEEFADKRKDEGGK